MSHVLVKSESAGARVKSRGSHNSWSSSSSVVLKNESEKDSATLGIQRAAAQTDVRSVLRETFQIEDEGQASEWLEIRPELIPNLILASAKVDRLFGPGRAKWLSLLEDWEGQQSLSIEVEFSGSGSEASRLCRRFVAEWLVDQPLPFQEVFSLGVRFLP